MLKSLFHWLDGHSGSYWAITGGASLLLLVWVARLVRREARPSVGWGDALVLFLFILAWRWPFLFVADEFNPDESQLVAGAITLTHDPVFWRSVDGTTSGPLNFYALLPLHWLGLPLDYFSARLTGLLLVAGALFAGLHALAHTYGRPAAWLGVVPGAAYFATATHPDLIHYSSEHAPLLLVAASFGLLAVRAPTDRVRLAMALLIAGAAPWAKLQTSPLALVLISWGLWQVVWRDQDPRMSRFQRTILAAFWALGPTILIVTIAGATGQLETAFRRYFVHNVFYVSQGTNRTALEAFAEMTRFAIWDRQLPVLLAGVFIAVMTAAGFFVVRRTRPTALVTAGGCLAAAALFAVAAPRREYVHYLLLLPVPFTLWGGAAVGEWWGFLASARHRRLLAAFLLILGVVVPLGLRTGRPVPAIYGDLSYHWRHPRTSASIVVKALAGPRGSIGVWGWASRLYVETGLPQATRDAHSTWSIFDNAQRDYHRSIYLADLRRNQPEVFVDAVGPGAFVFNDRAAQSHETFPELAAYVQQHYSLVADLVEMRIYGRRDLPTLAGLTPARIDQLVNQGRLLSPKALPVPPPLGRLEEYPRKIVERRNAVLLLPPVQMEWALDPDVRQVSVEFGLDPLTYLQGNTDGAEMRLEVSAPGQSRMIYQRLLQPATQPADRGAQFAKVTLPPLPPDARLVLRTSAGPAGNNAWDWLYLAALEFHRSPAFLPAQFPNFSRVPDSADALNSAPTPGPTGPDFLMHAPGSVAYVLQPGEHRLQFSYGFQAGAYTDGGRTDGARYRVELQRLGQPPRILFERLLEPVANVADQGIQHLDLDLPADATGAKLVISIDAGPAGNAAWDWTLLNQVTLK